MGCSVSTTVDPAANNPKKPAAKPGPSDEPTAKRPRREPRLVTENDLVWREKKKLIPDLNVFKEIDQRAITAPDNLRSNPAGLVAYLIAPCKTELEKYRAIFRWIASHIDYDVEFLDTGRPVSNKAEDCLVTGRAICAGYSGIVKELCSHAEIDMETVSGCSKGGNYRVGDKEEFGITNGLPTNTDHAWVIVRLNGRQFLCDPTWAAGKIEKKNGKTIFNREWEESYFLSDPKAFFETHWPMGNENESLPDKQLMKSPNKNFTDWLERPHRKMAASCLGVNLTSNKEGLIKTKQNEVDIEFTSKYKLETLVSMEMLKDNAWIKIDDMKLAYREGDKYKVRIRLPYGNVPFVVKILGKLTEAEGELAERQLFIASYRIICTGEGNNKGYHPKFCKRAGIEPDAAKLGFKLESHKGPMILSKGKELVAISTPNSDPISQAPHLYRLRDNQLLDGQVYVERTKDKLICHVRMYEQGEYALMIYGDLLQEGGSTLPTLGTFLINCTSPLPNELPAYCKNGNIHGPNNTFISLGLKDLSGDSSIKTAGKGGQCSIKFKVPLHETYKPLLFDCSGNRLPSGHCAGVLDGNTLTILLKLPEPGNFTLELFRKTTGTTLDRLAQYMIKNDDPFQGELFPELYDIIGPLPQAAEAGLTPLDPKMKYHVKTSKPDHIVKFVANSNLDTFGVLEWNGDQEKRFKQVAEEKGGKSVLTYDVELPSAGIYSFEIWLNSSPTKKLVAMMIEYTYVDDWTFVNIIMPLVI
ncbi:uncharacterized protein LOC135502376 [Lineus longissimus]|uniref:uncharacterized protein LOC135502376 n=1 Tax=Lineus longissimus TaxID=88925 RepID=UPI002B4C95A9